VPGRIRSAQPATGVRNIEIASTRWPSGEGADVRVRGGLVAGHDQELDRLWIRLLPVGSRAQPSATRGPAVREETRRCRLLGEPSWRPGGDHLAAVSIWAGPDQDALGAADAVAELLRTLARPPPGSPICSDDPGAGSARGLDPEVDDRSPLDDRIVADDHDQLGVPDRGQRQAERVKRGADVLWHDRAVGAEPLP
jgi:hypothetical protein